MNILRFSFYPFFKKKLKCNSQNPPFNPKFSIKFLNFHFLPWTDKKKDIVPEQLPQSKLPRKTKDLPLPAIMSSQVSHLIC